MEMAKAKERNDFVVKLKLGNLFPNYKHRHYSTSTFTYVWKRVPRNTSLNYHLAGCQEKIFFTYAKANQSLILGSNKAKICRDGIKGENSSQ